MSTGTGDVKWDSGCCGRRRWSYSTVAPISAAVTQLYKRDHNVYVTLRNRKLGYWSEGNGTMFALTQDGVRMALQLGAQMGLGA